MENAIACPHCDGVIRVAASLAGETVKCPFCQRTLRVPAAGDGQSGELDSPQNSSTPPSRMEMEAASSTAGTRTRLNVEDLLPPRYEIDLPATTDPQFGQSPRSHSLVADDSVRALSPAEPAKLIEVAGRERRLRRLSPEERWRRRRIRNVVMFLAGVMLLVLAAAILMRK